MTDIVICPGCDQRYNGQTLTGCPFCYRSDGKKFQVDFDGDCYIDLGGNDEKYD